MHCHDDSTSAGGTNFRRLSPLAGAAAACLFCISPGIAQDYPSKPVRLVAPFSAGGSADNAARLIAVKLSDHLGQPVIVDNRPGAGGRIGSELVAKATPDGHTLLWVNSNHVINASLHRKLPYDTRYDFLPVSLAATTAFVLIAHPSLEVATVQELVRVARSKPGNIDYASLGIGSGAYFAAELFNIKARVKLGHVPYKGVAQAMPEVLAGTVPVMFPNLGNAYSHVRAGRLRGLAVTTAQRSSLAPEIPTIQEGGVSGYEFSNWYGLLAPRAVPRLVVARIAQGMKNIANMKDVRIRISSDGGTLVASTPDDFRKHLDVEFGKYAALISNIGLRVK